MYDNYNYPAGADTPNAPWNQVELDDIYGDDANDQINDEIDEKDETFLDWAYENDYLPEEYTDDDVDNITRDEAVRNAYHDYRIDDVIEELAEKDADEQAYWECERAEAAREAYLLGE